jgi:hypothetical protein
MLTGLCGRISVVAQEIHPLRFPPPGFVAHEREVFASGLQLDADGNWYRPAEALAPDTADPARLPSADTDDFGYTWDRGPFQWVDASGGTDTGLGSSPDHVGPIPLGFAFKYYEKTYTQLYISLYGFIAFSNTGLSAAPNPPSPIPACPTM